MSFKSLPLATLVFILYLSPFNTIRFFYPNAWTVTTDLDFASFEA